MNLRTLLAAMVCGVASGCVMIKSVDDDQLPASWRQSLPAKPTALRDVSGTYLAEGQSVHSDGKVVAQNISFLFFPGQRLRRPGPDRCALSLDKSGQLTVTATSFGAPVATATFQTEFDRGTGALLVKSIPVTDLNEFGRVASTQSARLYLGTDRALYARVRQSGAGIVLFVPVAGTSLNWGRWESAPP